MPPDPKVEDRASAFLPVGKPLAHAVRWISQLITAHRFFELGSISRTLFDYFQMREPGEPSVSERGRREAGASVRGFVPALPLRLTKKDFA